MNKTFLGFGLGAIQSGLMLLEAVKSGNFKRFVILEVNEKLVAEIRNAGNSMIVNTATKGGIDKLRIENIEIYNPTNPNDLNEIDEAIFSADEMATAIPSVDYYELGGESSIANLLAKNINPLKPQILYASENNMFAAELLLKQVQKHSTKDVLRNFMILNTVIGKMSGVIQDAKTISELGLDTITNKSSSAILVEEFNKIIVSSITHPGYSKGINVFVEKEYLTPFEEAKLFGHNAVHSMLGFLAYLKGYNYMSEIKNDKELWNYGETAFQKESGAFLLKKYDHINDTLFTQEGFLNYGNDLLERMTNPYLKDEVQRICRDPLRKLGYSDRLVGTIREALKQGVTANTIAKGVLAGLCYLIKERIDIGIDMPSNIYGLNKNYIFTILTHIWKDDEDDGLKENCLNLIISQFDEFAIKFIS
ncbi:MAG: hypothetical protein L3J41_09215 [Melioribacteraceae bacterium]|nr:hypothetical protein [Melioribacteraceae bacterium]